MIYQFKCPKCNNYEEIVRHHSESGLPHYCNECGNISDRVYSVPNVSIPHTESYYDYGLGCKISNKQDKINAIKKIEGETGMKLSEVGTDDIKKQVKAPNMDYDIPRGIFDGAITE